ncbi:MAG: hypothetical protein JWO05_732 [Gemmatimonadetes bacterium]|nr:hypothetical protein [Gemmatimonadota bacterium]
MAKPTAGNQPGAQQHAEGQHGDKTKSRIQEQLHERGSELGLDLDADREEASGKGKPASTGDDGHHRLSEDREQHDEAEKNSEKNRALGEGHS